MKEKLSPPPVHLIVNNKKVLNYYLNCFFERLGTKRNISKPMYLSLKTHQLRPMDFLCYINLNPTFYI